MKERIINVMKQVFDFDSTANEISQLTCENWDSMAHLHLVFGLEKEFDVSFEPEEIMEMNSLKKIEGMLEKKGFYGSF